MFKETLAEYFKEFIIGIAPVELKEGTEKRALRHTTGKFGFEISVDFESFVSPNVLVPKTFDS